MTDQLATFFELLVTLGTDKRLLTNVNSTMTDQLATLFELLVTLWTDNRLLTTFEKKIFVSKIWNKYFEKCRRQKWHPLLDELEQTAPQSIISLAQNNVLNFLILQTYFSAMISYQSVPQLAILASSLTLTCPSLIKSTLYPNLAMFTFETSVEFAIFLVFLQPLFELLVTLWTDNRLLTTFEKKYFFSKNWNKYF